MSITADLKLKIPHIRSVYVGFAVPPTQSLVSTHICFPGSKLFLRQMESQFLCM